MNAEDQRIAEDEAAHILQALRKVVSSLEVRLTHSTKQDLIEIGNQIMSAISDFAAKQAAFNKRTSDAIDGVVAGVTGLTGDIQSLDDKITALQNSPGAITPEDQKLLDDITTQSSANADKAEAVKSAVDALDALTPPVPPAATP